MLKSDKPNKVSDKATKAPRISWLDMLVYRLFFWRWKPLLEKRPDLLEAFDEQLQGFKAKRRAERDEKVHLRRIK